MQTIALQVYTYVLTNTKIESLTINQSENYFQLQKMTSGLPEKGNKHVKHVKIKQEYRTAKRSWPASCETSASLTQRMIYFSYLCMVSAATASKLSHWFKLNKLSLNIKKTNFIAFKPRTKSLTGVPNVLIDGYAVNKVESSRFLGVVTNSSLDWNNHINLINSKVSKTIGILKYVKNKLSDHILRSL